MTDEQLLFYIKNGQTDLFKELVFRYQSKVMAVAWKVTNNQKDAEDVAQEVFLQAFRSINQFRGDSSFSTWLLKIAMNKSLDWKRKQKEVLQPFDDVFAGVGNCTEQLIIEKSNRETIHSAVAYLPEKYKIVITLYYFEERSYKEIGETLGIAAKTVESRLYRARHLLKEHLKEELA